ncbi:Splicing factor [Ascochyta rabiei]|uniref:Splicing factor n=1 Tax=Didymella rabiei TaxID=5454 RepID=UPI0022004746|nr:Splicing factor [Ascochyta rabiei]UPX12765.1 Splicing factor [Ascochyta rabiei]
MDINSLLSPSDSPAQTPPPPPAHPSPSTLAARSPGKHPVRQPLPSRTPSGLSQQITSSPQLHLAHQNIPSPGYAHLTNGARPVHSATSTPQPLGSPHDARMTPPSHLYRQASTPGMDALADLASMQQQQQATRQNSLGHQRPVTLQHLGQHLSGESVASVAMSEHSPRPRSFATRSLDQQHIDYLDQLDRDLIENPFNYYSHLALVTTLHQGFQNHLASIDLSPHAYELIHILRDAYRVMSEKYPLGETLWHYRLNDEKILATNSEERMGVLELHKQATHEEPYSAKLWAAYGEYVSYLVACSWEQLPPEEWSEEDRLIGRELFQPQLLMDALQQGAERVKYNLQESNLVWDRYLQVLEEDLERTGLSQEKVTRIASIYNERLGLPHATWSHTRSRYISFIQRYNLGDPEQVNEQVTQKNTHIIQQCANREDYEFKVLQAIQQGDQNAEYHAITRYLKWEKRTMGVYSFPLVNALYERATLRFPVDPSIWEDHVEFLIWQQNRSVDLLNVLERATRHCPWSGSLWSHRILTLEVENKAFEDIEHVKHTATGTGLLEHSDLEEIIKVQIAWCGYLRRRAFDDPKATDDDADIAEVGIRSALEFVREVGMKKHGRDWAGDTKYRLERIHMKYWLQRGNVDEARNIWESLVKRQADSYDFWYRWYIFEMVFWSQHAIRTEQNAGQQLLTPTRATAVLERAMERLQTINHPEPIVEMYMNHCEQHETALKVRSAVIEKRRAERMVSIRKDKEKAAAEAAAAAARPQPDDFTDVSGKRKRDDTGADEDATAKKSRQADSEDVSPAAVPVDGETVRASEAPSEGQSGLKRDREHTSVIVKKLPADTTQTQIRQFFTDAGTVRNLVLKPEQDSLTAVVEFETSEEADYALSKEAKGFKGHNISIERGESTTLYVTNYPAHADEAYLRKHFAPFGEIIGFRFPSLKFDTHRRFCYVQFANAAQAVAATQLDGTDVEGLKLSVKISNPQAKKKRDGATAEGREVYVWHLNFKIKKQEVQETFAQFGHIDRINFPTLKNGNNKGFCFVVYDTKDSADAAAAEMDKKDFWGLELHVEIANDRNETKPKIRSTLENAVSPAAPDATPGAAEAAPATAPAASFKAAPFNERSLAILNLPDTVPDVRIKPLVEKYGFKKITLEPQHGGAVIEFTSVEGAGKAEIALQGLDFEGRKLRVGTVRDLRQQKGEWKAANSFVQPNRVNRPTARGGGRARGRTGFGARPAVPRAAAPMTNGEAAKSNNDFRNMILNQGGKEAAKSEDRMEE